MLPTSIYDETTRYFLNPIRSLLEDPDVSEIMINGPERVYFERRGKLHLSECKFTEEAALMAAVRNIAEYVNRRVDDETHSMDARLPDGSRVHVIIPPCSRVGTCLTIRKFIKSSFSLEKLVASGSMTEEVAEFLELAVLLRKNIVIAGGTGTGKTSLLNALSARIPEDERIVVIEDSSELQLAQPHTIYLESRPARPDGKGQVTIRDLFVDSLRMRPDRIVVGEVRRGEALDLVQSMISGHDGSLTTVHASSPHDAAIRLETLCLLSNVELPVHVARTQVASALNLVVQIRRFRDGTRRVVTVAEMLGLDAAGHYSTQPIYEFRSTGTDATGNTEGGLTWSGVSPSFADEVEAQGLGDRVSLTERILVKKLPDQ